MSIILIISIVICCVIVVSIAGSNKFRGKCGEWCVRAILSFLPSQYRVINDLRIYVNGRKCQIDHLVVSPYGIFVIETKNYFGVTSGDVRSPMLQRSVLGMHYRTRNPLMQNQYHVDLLLAKLRKTMKIDEAGIKPILVLNLGNIVRLSGRRDNVVMFYNLLRYIRSFRTIVFQRNEIKAICSLLRHRA